MSKPVKELIAQEYQNKFEGLNGAVIIDIRGIQSNTTNALRASLHQKQIKITVVKNSLVKNAVVGTELESLGGLLQGANALVYPVSDDVSIVGVARELLAKAKEVANLEFKGAVMDGIVFGPDEIKRLSEYPTKEEAQAKVVQIVLTPGQKLVGAILSPGSKLASILKTIQEKLESGEAIQKVA